MMELSSWDRSGATGPITGIFAMPTKKLWILEDDEIVIDLYRIAFVEFGDGRYELSIFRSLGEFLTEARAIEREVPDLLISDLCLPDGNFSTIFTSQQKFTAATTLQVPVMVASGWSDLDPMRRLLAAGVVDFITKPFAPTELLAKAERHLIPKEGMTHQFGDGVLTIDPASLTIAGLTGQSVELTSKQFQIMMLLLKHLGAAVAKDDVSKHVWGSVNVSPKNMNVHISLLRQKLRPIGLNVVFVPPGHYALEDLVAAKNAV